MFEMGKPFFRGNLHMHTKVSDGRLDLSDALSRYRAAGYDFVCVTDHRKRAVAEHFLDGMLVLPGIELDYNPPAQAIHIVGVGIGDDVSDMVRLERGAQWGVDAIRASGGRAILAHPAWSLNTPETICGLRNLTAAEIYNTVSGAPWNGDRADASNLLDIAAANGSLLGTVASDDAHFYDGDECASYIMLQAESLSGASVLSALDAGAFYATQGPRIGNVTLEGDTVRVTCSGAKYVLFHSNLPWAGGRCVSGEDLTEASYTVNRARGENFVRVIVVDARGRRAWANPIRV